MSDSLQTTLNNYTVANEGIQSGGSGEKMYLYNILNYITVMVAYDLFKLMSLRRMSYVTSLK